MSIYEAFLGRGYFPKELPSAFSSRAFAKTIVASAPPKPFWAGKLKRARVAECARHNLVRPGGTKRRVRVPHPVLYHQLAAVLAENWSTLQAHYSQSSSSLSSPVEDKSAKRGVTGSEMGRDAFDRRARNRAGKRDVVVTDIESCYASVYTHSIPWALHGKSASKANRGFTWNTKSPGLIGNDIDLVVRNCQDGQTIGIPISPDTSLAVFEIIGTELDKRIAKRFPRLVRVIDDIEIAVDSTSDAERAIHMVEEVLSDFELQLNPRKTRIEELPQPIRSAWLLSTRDANIRKTARLQRKDLEKYFEAVFAGKAEQRTSHVLSYALPRFMRQPIHRDNLPVFQDLVWQCVAAEPSCLRVALAILEQHTIAGYSVDLDLLQETLSNLVAAGVSLERGNQVAWSLWGMLLFQRHLSVESIRTLPLCRDPFVGVLALDADRCGLCRGGLNTAPLEAHVCAAELYGPMWPLAYEARARKWLAGSDGDFIGADEAMAFLNAQQVRFYNPFSLAKGGPRKARPESLNLKRIKALLARRQRLLEEYL